MTYSLPSSMPKNTKTFPRTFVTFSPHGCSSVASGFASA